MESQRDGINPSAERAGPAARNVWRQAAGGFICAGAPNAVISAAATHRPISTRRSIITRPAIRLSRVSSLVSGGSTTIALAISSTVRAWPLRVGIRKISRRRALPDVSPPTGKSCCISRCATTRLSSPIRSGSHSRCTLHPSLVHEDASCRPTVSPDEGRGARGRLGTTRPKRCSKP